MRNIGKGDVGKAFREAGVWSQGQVKYLENVATNKINQLDDMKPEGWKIDWDNWTIDRCYTGDQKDAIGNLFGYIGDRVIKNFDKTDNNQIHRANAITYDALKSLGVADKLSEASATSMDKLKMDVDHFEFRDTVKDVASLTSWWGNDGMAKKANAWAAKYGLNITGISWDDPNRENTQSPWGSNIIDAGLKVSTFDAKTGVREDFNVPMVRTPNLQDVTADIDLDKFMINVGNAKGKSSEKVSLKDVLKAPWKHLMNDESKWPLRDASGKPQGVYVSGVDEEARVAAQHAIFPVAPDGTTTFTPTARSYTSYNHKDHGPQPTVLNIVVTHEGASMEILGDDAKGNGPTPMWFGGSPDEMHMNINGERAPYTATRAADGADTGGHGAGNANAENRILHIQIPLTPEHPQQNGGFGFGLEGAPMMATARGAGGGLGDASIGHGPIEGDYNEDMGKGWTRDESTPIRITVQYTHALTDPSKLTEGDFKRMSQEIKSTYDENNASRVGSLVFPDGMPTPPLPPPIGPIPVPWEPTPMPGPGIPTPVTPEPVTPTPVTPLPPIFFE